MEEVLLLQGLGRVLAEPVLADRDFPPFPRATRDGFAVHAQDLQNGRMTLRVVGQVKAGDSYDLPVASGEAVEIMTGAAVPAGADTVVMVEYTQRKTAEVHYQGNEATQSKASGRASDDDSILDIAENAQNKIEPRVEELVEIQRVTSAGENIVPAGAEAQTGQELLPSGTPLGTCADCHGGCNRLKSQNQGLPQAKNCDSFHR